MGLLKNPLFLGGLAALITWWLLRKKADCHCDDAGTGATPPPAIWQGYGSDPYPGGRTGGGPPVDAAQTECERTRGVWNVGTGCACPAGTYRSNGGFCVDLVG